MKLCVFGSSHVASFKLAEAEISARYPAAKIDFFGAPQPVFSSMKCGADGVFRPDPELVAANRQRPRVVARGLKEINGAAALDLRRYDAAFLVGRQINMADILRLLADYDVDGFPDRGRDGMMSAAAFDALARDVIAANAPDDMANIAKATKAFAAVFPATSAAALDDPAPEFDYLRDLSGDPEALRPALDRVHALIAERFAELGLRYVRQRAETAPGGLVTRAEHSVGSRRLAGAGELHDDRDYAHMNETYARLCFDDFAEAAGLEPGE